MIKIIGFLFIVVSVLLTYMSFDKIKYDSYGNEITINKDQIYATADGIGVEYFLKDNLQFTSIQVFIVIISTFLFGIFLILIDKAVLSLVQTNISFLSLYLSIFISIVLTIIIKYTPWGYSLFFKSELSLLLIGIIYLIAFSIINKIWKSFFKSKLFFLFLLLICLNPGLNIFIELGNHVQTSAHEGNWGQVDENFIIIFFSGIKHKWTLGYTLFRISNIVLFVLSIYFLAKTKNYITSE